MPYQTFLYAHKNIAHENAVLPYYPHIWLRMHFETEYSLCIKNKSQLLNSQQLLFEKHTHA